MSTRHLNRRTRRGQGMTEYIIVVGLVAILLIGAITRFRNQIDVTIRGTTNQVNKLAPTIAGNNGNNNNNSAPPPGTTMTTTGKFADAAKTRPIQKGSDGRFYVNGQNYTGPQF